MTQDHRLALPIRQAAQRLSDPQDVADMALFLASNAARMISGQALAVDGMTYNVDP